jgi:hypothetical protein
LNCDSVSARRDPLKPTASEAFERKVLQTQVFNYIGNLICILIFFAPNYYQSGDKIDGNILAISAVRRRSTEAEKAKIIISRDPFWIFSFSQFFIQRRVTSVGALNIVLSSYLDAQSLK